MVLNWVEIYRITEVSNGKMDELELPEKIRTHQVKRKELPVDPLII